MIKINLLPSEKRKAERTPLPRFFLIVVNVAAAALFALGIVYYTLIKIPGVERDIKAAQDLRKDLQPKVDEHDALVKDRDAVKTKVEQIVRLTNRGIEWWQAVNAVWEVIQDNPKVWIDEIRMIDGKGVAGELKKADSASKDTPPFGLGLKCHTAGDEVLTLTSFRAALKKHPTLSRILPGVNFSVDWKKDDEKDFPEKNSLSFNVTLFGASSAPPPPVAKGKAAAAKPAAK